MVPDAPVATCSLDLRFGASPTDLVGGAGRPSSLKRWPAVDSEDRRNTVLGAPSVGSASVAAGWRVGGTAPRRSRSQDVTLAEPTWRLGADGAKLHAPWRIAEPGGARSPTSADSCSLPVASYALRSLSSVACPWPVRSDQCLRAICRYVRTSSSGGDRGPCSLQWCRP